MPVSGPASACGSCLQAHCWIQHPPLLSTKPLSSANVISYTEIRPVGVDLSSTPRKTSDTVQA